MPKLRAEVPCPNCNRKFKIRVEDMRPGNSRSCPSCGVTINFRGDDGRKTQKALDDLEKTMKKLGNIKFKL